MTLRRSLLAAGAALSLAGCSNHPTSPIVEVPLSVLVVSPHADTLFVGESNAFVVTAEDTVGDPVSNPVLTWVSRNPAVFSVSSTGLVRARSKGSGRLIVSSGGRSDSADVLVLPTESGWFRQTSGTTFDLNGVFFLPDGNAGWAVGAGGRIIATTNAGQSWTTQPSNTSFTLNAVWFTSAREGWAVGQAGTVLHTTNSGGDWERVSAPASENLLDVQFATRDTGLVVGSNGLVLRTFDRDITWQTQHPTAFTLRGVSFAGTRDGWAVGDGGTILGTHDRGVSWFLVAPPVTSQALRAVWRTSPDAAWAVGDQGAAPRGVAMPPDTAHWEIRNAGASNQLDGVCFANDSTGYAVGYNNSGVVLRTEDRGVTWAAQVSNTQFRLTDVYFVDDRRGWAVGSGGVVIHTATGGAP